MSDFSIRLAESSRTGMCAACGSAPKLNQEYLCHGCGDQFNTWRVAGAGIPHKGQGQFRIWMDNVMLCPKCEQRPKDGTDYLCSECR